MSDVRMAEPGRRVLIRSISRKSPVGGQAAAHGFEDAAVGVLERDVEIAADLRVGHDSRSAGVISSG